MRTAIYSVVSSASLISTQVDLYILFFFVFVFL